MTNNKNIQILRDTPENIMENAEAGVDLLYSQSLYNLDSNYLTVQEQANGNSPTKEPIDCREIIGYAEDDYGITANKPIEYGGSVYGW